MAMSVHSDCLTLAMRLYGTDEATMAPETIEVMRRWNPIVEATLREIVRRVWSDDERQENPMRTDDQENAARDAAQRLDDFKAETRRYR